MQRTEFLNPEVEVIEFEAEDVITSSTGGGLNNGGILPEGGGDSIDVDDLFP